MFFLRPLCMFTIFLVLISLLNAQSTNTKDKTKPESVEVYVNKRDLFVNKSNEHYRVAIDRSVGENKLLIFAQTSDIEEAWIYIEGNDAKGKKTTLWYEIGENDRSAFVDIGYDEIGELIEESRLNNIAVSLYHIHPKNNDPTQGITATETPSPNDIKGLFFTRRVLFINEKYKGPFDSRIVTPTGVYTMKHSAEVLEWDEDKFIEYEVDLYYAWEKARDELFHTGQYQKARGSNEIAQINDSVARMMTKEPHFTVTFQNIVQ